MNVRSFVVMVLIALIGALIYLDWSVVLSGLHAFHFL